MEPEKSCSVSLLKVLRSISDNERIAVYNGTGTLRLLEMTQKSLRSRNCGGIMGASVLNDDTLRKGISVLIVIIVILQGYV